MHFAVVLFRVLIGLLLFSFVNGALAQPYNPNTYLPGLNPLPDDPEIRAAAISAFEEPTQTKESLKLFESLMDNPDRGAEAHMMYAIFIADGSDGATVKQRRTLQSCVYKFREYAPCYVWFGLHLKHIDDEGSALEGARKAFETADRLGSPAGTWHLAMMYLNGESVKRDETRAFELVSKSARSDYIPALHSYAIMKTLEQGTARDECAAFNAAARGASLGDARSMAMLGDMLVTGICKPKNPALADVAVFRAWQMGHKDSAHRMEKHWNTLDEEQKAEFSNSIVSSRAEFDQILNAAAPID